MKRVYRLSLILLTVQIIFVLVCGPHSCEWGNGVYVCFGVAGLGLSFLFPLLQRNWPQKKRLAISLLFLLGWVILWCAGFMLGEFRLMCRMF